MVGAREFRSGRVVLLIGAGGATFTGLFAYALARTAQEGLSDAQPVDLWALAFSVAALMATVVVWRSQVAADPIGRGRAAAADLARQVFNAETPQFHQVLGGDSHRIDLSYVRLPGHPRSAATSHATGHMYAAVSGAGPAAHGPPDIHTYYLATWPRRLVISGRAGAGKTALALELLLALIEDRQEDDPVPVRMTAAQWDSSVPLQKHIVAHLVAAYGCSRSTAKVVVDQGRVLPVLDGLDEMDPTLPDGTPSPDQPRCRAVLEALNAYQTGRHPGPVIVTCRASHYNALLPHDRLRDAARVEVAPISADQVRTYLLGRDIQPHVLQPLLDALGEDPTGTLATTLSNPWQLSLAATVLAHDGDPADLLNHPDPKALEAHLLARLVPASTALADNPRGYSPRDVERWLTEIARHLAPTDVPGGRQPTSRTDIVLHRLWPMSGNVRVRCLHLTVLVCGVVAFSDFVMGSLDSSVIAYAVVLLAALIRTTLRCDVTPKTLDIRKLLTWRGVRQVVFGLMLGLPIALGIGVSYALFGALAANDADVSFSHRLAEGFVLGVLVGPALGLSFGVNRGLSEALTPRDPLRNDLLFGCAFGLMFWLGYGLAFWPVLWLLTELGQEYGFASLYYEPGVGAFSAQFELYGPAYGFSSGMMAEFLTRQGVALPVVLASALGLVEALIFGLALGSPAWTRYAVAFGLSKRKAGLPRRPGAFCEWAYRAGLLRVSGIAYQFRHAELQHWLTHRWTRP